MCYAFVSTLAPISKSISSSVTVGHSFSRASIGCNSISAGVAQVPLGVLMSAGFGEFP